MAIWINTFEPNKIAEPAITWVRDACSCGPKEIEVSPEARDKFCIPAFQDEGVYVTPYQNVDNACSRIDIEEKELPNPFCWDEPECFDKCDRLSINVDKCERYKLCGL